MSENIDLINQISESESLPDFSIPFTGNLETDQKIIDHKAWLNSIRHEQPSPKHHYRVGIYIRYFNQTNHDNYLDYHVQQYKDTMALLPNWELIDFYIDEGSTAPNMESAKEWCRLLNDCFAGKVNLIVTQKVSNVSKKHYEISIVARMLAALENPVGMFFVSENIFTLASYYKYDNHDMSFFPSDEWKILPDDNSEEQSLLLGDSAND